MGVFCYCLPATGGVNISSIHPLVCCVAHLRNHYPWGLSPHHQTNNQHQPPSIYQRPKIPPSKCLLLIFFCLCLRFSIAIFVQCGKTTAYTSDEIWKRIFSFFIVSQPEYFVTNRTLSSSSFSLQMSLFFYPWFLVWLWCEIIFMIFASRLEVPISNADILVFICDFFRDFNG